MTTTADKSTEIRCEEKSRGGMSYEMVLAEPISDKPESEVIVRPKSTVEDINTKLVRAEERRKSLEAIKIASITERLAKLEEASLKRDEANKAFIATSQAALEEKFDIISTNRENHFKAMKTKISEHLNGVENVRKMLEDQSEELRDTINLKLTSAQENREEHFKKFINKLKEHDDYAQKVRLGHDESIRQLEKNIETKLNVAEARRLSEQNKKLETLREHGNKVIEVHENRKLSEVELSQQKEILTTAYENRIRKISTEKENKRKELGKTTLTKIEQAQEAKHKEEARLRKETQEKLALKIEAANRIKEEMSLKALKIKEENERRAENVRSKKEKFSAVENGEIASSG